MEDLLSQLGTGQGGYNRVEVEHLYPHNFHEFTISLFLQVWFEETNLSRLTRLTPPRWAGLVWWSSFNICMPGQSKIRQLSNLILHLVDTTFPTSSSVSLHFVVVCRFFSIAGQPTSPKPPNVLPLEIRSIRPY